MRSILALAAHVLRLDLKEKSSIIWLFVMPIVFIGFFGQMFRSESGPRKIALSLVDEDGTYLSEQFAAMLASEDLDLRLVAPAARDTLADLGRTLVIPRGFADSLSAGEGVALTLAPRPGGRQEAELAGRVYISMGIARLLATLAEVDTARLRSESERLDTGDAAFRARFEAAAARPDLIRTDVRTAGKGKTLPSGFGASAPAMLVLFLLMNTVISGAVIVTMEKQSRCFARLTTAPVSRFGLLAGKVLGLLGIALLQSLVILAAGALLFGVWWGPSPPALLALLICLGLAAGGIGILLGGMLRTPEQANAIGWIVPLFLGAIGGCWWPLEVAPSWMQVAGHISPAAWAMDGLHGLLSFGAGAGSVVVPCLVLLLYGAAAIGIGSRLLKTS